MTSSSSGGGSLASEESSSHDTVHELSSSDVALIFFLLSLFSGSLVKWVSHLQCVRHPPPYTVVMFLLGGLLALINAGISSSLGLMGVALSTASHVHPHVILFLLLPPLLYEAAVSVDAHVFFRVFWQAIMLAGPGVLICTFLIAVYTQLTFGTSWHLPEALMLGAMLSATDPVAVVASLHELGAPEHLSMLIDGESLLNDGTAFVAFLVFKEMSHMSGAKSTWLEITGMSVKLSLGGPLYGLVAAYLTTQWLRAIHNKPVVEIAIVFAAVYATFVTSELVLGFSGVLAVVTFGVYMASRGVYAMSPHAQHTAHSFAAQISFFSESAIFLLAGLVAFARALNESQVVDMNAFLNALLLYVFLHVARAAVLAMLFPILRRLGYGLSVPEAAFVTFSGLRGAVSLALGLLLDADENINNNIRHSINFYIASTVCLTLLINGTISEWVYRKLGLAAHSKYRAVVFEAAMAELDNDFVSLEIERLRGHPLFRDAGWPIVKVLLPDFTSDVELRGDRLIEDVRTPNWAQVFSQLLSNRSWMRQSLRHNSHLQRQLESFQKMLDTVYDKTSDPTVGGPSITKTPSIEVTPTSSLSGRRSVGFHRKANSDGDSSLKITSRNREFWESRFGPEDNNQTTASPPPKPRFWKATSTPAKFNDSSGDDEDEDAGTHTLQRQRSNSSMMLSPPVAPRRRFGSGPLMPPPPPGGVAGAKQAGKPQLLATRRRSPRNSAAKPPEIDAAEAERRRNMHRLKSMSIAKKRRERIERRFLSVRTEDRSVQLVITMFNALRAAYQHQFDRHALGRDAIVVLLNATSHGSEVTQKKSGSDEGADAAGLQSAFEAEWTNLHDHLLKSLSIRHESCMDRFPLLKAAFDAGKFREAFTTIEILSAYIKAHINVLKNISRNVLRETRNEMKTLVCCLERAQKTMVLYKHSMPMYYTIVVTVLASQRVLQVKREKLNSLFDQGLIEKRELEILTSLLDRRSDELSDLRHHWSLARLRDRSPSTPRLSAFFTNEAAQDALIQQHYGIPVGAFIDIGENERHHRASDAFESTATGLVGLDDVGKPGKSDDDDSDVEKTLKEIGRVTTPRFVSPMRQDSKAFRMNKPRTSIDQTSISIIPGHVPDDDGDNTRSTFESL